ncbi:ABC transporter ATP-binding protein [Gorillibacterium massiliense]|uniref:ABC transporter ATP-binding protein n=1 Tax=Gorillibacterium massiliense TaxID=1280390 RepID=UPI000592A303|nr:ABC transporter ATP-binding protein [Gorillibacterium massiliense]
MAFFNPYLKKYGRSFALAVLFLTFETLCDLLQPTIMAKVIDKGVGSGSLATVWRLGGLMLLITAFGAVMATARNLISSRVSQSFGADLRSDLFRSIQTLSFKSIDKFDRASLVTRLTNDVTQLQNFVNGLMRILVKSPLLCIGSLIMAIRLNIHMAVVLAVVVPMVGVLIFANMKVGFPFFTRVQKALDRLNGISREYLSGVRVVKAFNRFDYEQAKFDGANREFQSRSITANRALSVFNPAISLTVNFGIVVVLWLGGWRVHNNGMQVGNIIAFINYMTQILTSLMMISMVFNMFVRARASASRIGEVFQENVSGGAESSVVLSVSQGVAGMETDAGAGEKVRGRIDFDHVTFSYDGASGEPVLREISFTALPGETVGIIGSTGSGKSTLVNLIPRFYDVTSGSIRVGGTDIRTLEPHRLRERIAVVPQKTVLFTGSVEENLRWGKEDATPEEMEQAARIASAHDFITASPEGYKSRIGQGGVNFSGGQKQRLSIARALVRQPEILILDDCTSAVDATTEANIKGALKQAAEGLTCLLIAQRITSVMDADCILVLDDGAIVGSGTHDELLADCRVYREIFRSQMGKEALRYVSSSEC